MDELSKWVADKAQEHGILRNGYFSALADGRMSREVFGRTQQQFFFAVRYFSRPLAALMARMPDSALRQGLIHNLTEEHGGEDGGGFDPALAHDRTFRRFLETLSMAEGMRDIREGAVVRAFNTSLMGACLMEPREVAFGCLGVIEHAFAGISALIGEVVVERGWVAAEELVHYKLHAEIDEQHAADFFKMVAEAWSAGGEGRQAVEDGVRLGLHVFDRLYLDLLEEAGSS